MKTKFDNTLDSKNILKKRFLNLKLKLLSLSFLSWLIVTALVIFFALRDKPENALGYIIAYLGFTEFLLLGRKHIDNRGVENGKE